MKSAWNRLLSGLLRRRFKGIMFHSSPQTPAWEFNTGQGRRVGVWFVIRLKHQNELWYHEKLLLNAKICFNFAQKIKYEQFTMNLQKRQQQQQRRLLNNFNLSIRQGTALKLDILIYIYMSVYFILTICIFSQIFREISKLKISAFPIIFISSKFNKNGHYSKTACGSPCGDM